MRLIRFLLFSVLILFLAPFDTDASFGLKVEGVSYLSDHIASSFPLGSAK